MRALKAFILTLGLALGICSEAQTVFYIHKLLAPEGCVVEYNVTEQRDTFYIMSTVTSDRLTFISNPTMKIRTFSGKYLELKGSLVGNVSRTKSVVADNEVKLETEIRQEREIESTAKFRVTAEDFETIREGVAKIRLSMTPMNHDRTFKRDKIGLRLYELYMEEKRKSEDF